MLACVIVSGSNATFGDCQFPVTQSLHKAVWLQSMECSWCLCVCLVSANNTLNVCNDANEFSDDKMSELVDICWSDVDRVPHVSEDKLHPLLQKSPITSGPLRVAYARPFVCCVWDQDRYLMLRCLLQSKTLLCTLRILTLHCCSQHFCFCVHLLARMWSTWSLEERQDEMWCLLKDSQSMKR